MSYLMKIIAMDKVAGGIGGQAFLVTVEHQPGFLMRLFGAKPERVQYRGESVWWFRADTGNMITAAECWSRDYAAKRMLVNWYNVYEWSLADREAAERVKGGLS